MDLARYRDLTDEQLAAAILNSEALMWLMVGANHPEAHCAALRPAWDEWRRRQA